MEINNTDLMSVQGQFAVGIQRKSLDVVSGLVNQLMNDSVAAADQARAEAGIGTKLNLTV